MWQCKKTNARHWKTLCISNKLADRGERWWPSTGGWNGTRQNRINSLSFSNPNYLLLQKLANSIWQLVPSPTHLGGMSRNLQTCCYSTCICIKIRISTYMNVGLGSFRRGQTFKCLPHSHRSNYEMKNYDENFPNSRHTNCYSFFCTWNFPCFSQMKMNETPPSSSLLFTGIFSCSDWQMTRRKCWNEIGKIKVVAWIRTPRDTISFRGTSYNRAIILGVFWVVKNLIIL